jgi:hypothetical protein
MAAGWKGLAMYLRQLARVAIGLLLIASVLGRVPALAQTLGPRPDPNDPIWLSIEPPTPEECYRFGLRYWVKKTLVDRKAACQCVKCGWSHLHRLCWRSC